MLEIESPDNLKRIAIKYGYDPDEFVNHFLFGDRKEISMETMTPYEAALELTDSPKKAKKLIELSQIFKTTL